MNIVIYVFQIKIHAIILYKTKKEKSLVILIPFKNNSFLKYLARKIKIPNTFNELLEYKTIWIKAIYEELNLILLKIAIDFRNAVNKLPNSISYPLKIYLFFLDNHLINCKHGPGTFFNYEFSTNILAVLRTVQQNTPNKG